jgi:Zn-dependent metalloprotease
VYIRHIDGYKKLDLIDKTNEVFHERKRETQTENLPQRIADLLTHNGYGVIPIDTGKTIENTKIIKFQEIYKGVPIYNAYVTEEVDSDTGEWTGQVTGSWYERVQEDIASVAPQLSENQVLYIAMSSEGLQDLSEVQESKCPNQWDCGTLL